MPARSVRAPPRRPAAPALAVLLFGLAGPALAQDGPAQVRVDAVRVEPLTQTMPVIGRFVAKQAGPIAARLAERVRSVEVQVGDRVAAGDVLATLESDREAFAREELLGQVRQYKARLTEAEARLKITDHELRRTEGLHGSAAFSQSRYEDAQQEQAAAQSTVARVIAEMQSTEANLKLAEVRLADTEIVAPFPGVVSVKHIAPGAFVSLGDPVVTLINDEDLEIEADVPSRRLGGLEPGTRVAVVLDDGSPHEAVVRAIIPDESPLTRTRAVRLVPDMGPATKPLAVNQSVTLHVPLGQPRDVVSVSKDAVITRGAQRLVYVVEDGKAQPRTVELGEAVGSRFEVLSGLAPGDRVVVRGNERLRPGQAVAPQPAGPKADPAAAGAGPAEGSGS